MKPTDKNNKAPYINAAKFFSFLLAAFVLFAIIAPRSNPSGFGDGNGPGVFGAGSGSGTGDGHGDGSMSGNTPKSLADAGKGENPDAKNTEYNPGKGDGKGDGEPPPPPPAEQADTQKDDQPPEPKQGNQQTSVVKKRNPNLPVAKLYLDPNKDDENKKPVKKVVKKTVRKTVKKTASARNVKMSDVGRGTGGGSRSFSASSGGKSVFRIQKHKNILFIVDISGSMDIPASEGQTRLSILQFQLKRTINEQHRVRSKGKYCIIAFSQELYYFPEKEKSGQAKFSHSGDLKKMEKWVDSFKTLNRNATYLFTALQNALDRIRQQGLEIDTIFILTDGEPNDESNPKQYLKLLKENLPHGIVINTISIGRSSDLLKEIAQNYNGAYDEYK